MYGKTWSFTLVITATTGLIGCGGGSSGVTNVDVPTQVERFPSLTDAIAAGDAASPTQASLQSLSVAVSIEADGSIELFVEDTLQRSYDGRDGTFQGFDIYSSADGSDVLALSRPGVGVIGGQDLEYTSFGLWAESDVPDLLSTPMAEVIDAGGFFVVSRTPPDRMPTTGGARYTGDVAAVEMVSGIGSQVLLGGLTADADFAGGTIDITADLSDIDRAAWGRVSMTGLAIAGNGFRGSDVSSSRGHDIGSAGGLFAGPSAGEIGGVFELHGPSDVTGAFAAAQ